MTFKWINAADVSQDLLNKFSSGGQAYDDYLHYSHNIWAANGEGVTYVAVLEEDYPAIDRIHAFCVINATGLMVSREDEAVEYLSCCEIRLFAISRSLRGARDEYGEKYSVNLFKSFLQDLYQMSTSVIGFRAIYLNSNDDGYHLYTDEAVGFMEPAGYIPATDEEKLDIEGCTPLLFFLDDDGIYKLFE